MNKFQLILTSIFGIFIVIGVIVFAAYKGSSGTVSTVVVWGTLPKVVFDDALKFTSLYQSKTLNVQYEEKTNEEFDAIFIEALASGTGPDVFMLPSEKILKHRNKIFPIPYSVFTERQFKDSFIEGAEIYMAREGILALPFYTNPLVMYWNRTLFTEAKLTSPPKYWDEFYDLATLISKKDGALNIQRSAVAFGEFANINHAKEIMLNLAMQAGTPVTMWSNGEVQSVIMNTFDQPTLPFEAAINFYTEFGNPAKTSYSWNRSLPSSTNYFLGGDLALYFGFANEINSLQLKNPNLNFDVATVPISREGGQNVSYANFNAFAITKSSKNLNAALAVINILTGTDAAKAFSSNLRLPSARRDLLATRPINAYESVFFDSAIKSKSWLDPNREESDKVFRNMIESITSGRVRVLEAISRADRELKNLLENR